MAEVTPDRFLGRRLIAAVQFVRWENAVAAAAKRALDARRARVLALVTGTEALTSSLPPDPFDLASWDDALTDEVGPAVQAIFVEIADKIARQFLGQPGSLLEIDLDHRLERMLGTMKGLGPDTATAIGRTLTVGVSEGESIDKLSGRIQDVFDSSDARATMIARTEVVGASNGASHDVAYAVAQAGYALDKLWLATGDDRTRDTHAEADGQQVAIDQPFQVGDSELMYPGDPDCDDAGEVVNCRCTITYEDAAGGSDAGGDGGSSDIVDVPDEIEEGG